MDLVQQFDINNAMYFTIQLIVAFCAAGFFIFSMIVSRQVQLMNRVLTTRLSGVFQFVSLAFTLSSGVVLALCILALLA